MTSDDKKAIGGASTPPTPAGPVNVIGGASNPPTTGNANEAASEASPRPDRAVVVDAFISEAVAPAPAIFTSTADIMASAREWCDENEERRFGSRALAKAMRERGVTKHSNGQRRGWRGVKLR